VIRGTGFRPRRRIILYMLPALLLIAASCSRREVVYFLSDPLTSELIEIGEGGRTALARKAASAGCSLTFIDIELPAPGLPFDSDGLGPAVSVEAPTLIVPPPLGGLLPEILMVLPEDARVYYFGMTASNDPRLTQVRPVPDFADEGFIEYLTSAATTPALYFSPAYMEDAGYEGGALPELFGDIAEVISIDDLDQPLIEDLRRRAEAGEATAVIIAGPTRMTALIPDLIRLEGMAIASVALIPGGMFEAGFTYSFSALFDVIDGGHPDRPIDSAPAELPVPMPFRIDPAAQK
jgi:hypothetical protein